MENDKVESQDEQFLSDNGTVDEEPTDELLAAELDILMNDTAPRTADTPKVEDVKDEEEVQEKEEEITGESEEDKKARHAEESRLGRKVAKINEQIGNMATKDDLLQIMNRLDDLRKERQSITPEYEREELGEHEELDLTTTEGLRAFNRQEREREAKEAKAVELDYTRGYVDTMKDLISEVDDPEVVKKIKSEMLKPNGECNKKYTGVPARDCAKNFAKALKIAQTKPATTFDKTGRVPNVATGVTGSSTGTKKADVLKHELDDYSKELIKDGKLSIAEINEALEGETPIHLRGRKI
jgi:hypothetical protein